MSLTYLIGFPKPDIEGGLPEGFDGLWGEQVLGRREWYVSQTVGCLSVSDKSRAHGGIRVSIFSLLQAPSRMLCTDSGLSFLGRCHWTPIYSGLGYEGLLGPGMIRGS